MNFKSYHLERIYPNVAKFDERIPYWNTFWFMLAIGFFSRAVENLIGYRAIGFIFLLAVLIVGFVGRLGPVLFAATTSWLSWNYFFIPPRFTLAISAPEDVFMCLTFFFVALATGILANRVKQQEFTIREREERTNLLYEVMLDISAGKNKNEFLEKIVHRLSHVLRGQCGILLKQKSGILEDPGKLYSLDVNGKETEAARACFENGKLTGWSTDIFDDSEALYLSIKGTTETVGIFRYKPDRDIHLSLDQENLLQSVCRQVGISLEQRFIEERLRETERLRESEEMHQTLLNSISHELRTPLTAIIGSASALEEEATFKNEHSRKLLILELKKSGERLNRVVENLLDMSRLNTGGIAIKKEWHDVSDLLGVTISRIRESLDRRKISVEIAADLPLIEIDFRLMEHALFNVLINAVTYSPESSEIFVRARKGNQLIEMLVEDGGPGIPGEYLIKIFEKFYRVPGSPPGGTGLGLSIAKSIIEFHQGKIAAENRAQGGTRFTLSLPFREPPAEPNGIYD
jgi:two-component system sensor histidine kinase KdpD